MMTPPVITLPPEMTAMGSPSFRNGGGQDPRFGVLPSMSGSELVGSDASDGANRVRSIHDERGPELSTHCLLVLNEERRVGVADLDLETLLHGQFSEGRVDHDGGVFCGGLHHGDGKAPDPLRAGVRGVAPD